MKKFLIFVAAMTLALSAAPAFAKGKGKKTKAAPRWECKTGDQTVMTASVNECMKLGGMVANYPGPDKAAPTKVKKSKKAKKAK